MPERLSKRATEMNDKNKHLKFELAPTTGIDVFRAVADDFMCKIFEFEPDDYLITHYSTEVEALLAAVADQTKVPLPRLEGVS